MDPSNNGPRLEVAKRGSESVFNLETSQRATSVTFCEAVAWAGDLPAACDGGSEDVEHQLEGHEGAGPGCRARSGHLGMGTWGWGPGKGGPGDGGPGDGGCRLGTETAGTESVQSPGRGPRLPGQVQMDGGFANCMERVPGPMEGRTHTEDLWAGLR